MAGNILTFDPKTANAENSDFDIQNPIDLDAYNAFVKENFFDTFEGGTVTPAQGLEEFLNGIPACDLLPPSLAPNSMGIKPNGTIDPSFSYLAWCASTNRTDVLKYELKSGKKVAHDPQVLTIYHVLSDAALGKTKEKLFSESFFLWVNANPKSYVGGVRKWYGRALNDAALRDPNSSTGAAKSNHKIGKAVDIHASLVTANGSLQRTPGQFEAVLHEAVKDGKIHAGIFIDEKTGKPINTDSSSPLGYFQFESSNPGGAPTWLHIDCATDKRSNGWGDKKYGKRLNVGTAPWKPAPIPGQ